MVGIDSQIILTQKILDGLVRDREQVQRDLDDHQIILSPARRLPNDVLTEIFLGCVEELGDLDSSNAPSTLGSQGMPWCLAQVSHRWRAVALSFPKLWSTIRIKFPIDDVATANACRRWESILGAQLHRSSSHSLSVHLDIHPASNPTTATEALFRILTPSSPRWETLSLRMPHTFLNAVAGTRGFLQSLAVLDVMIFGSHDIILASPLVDLFEYAPRLHTLLSFPRLRCCRLPWSQISAFITAVRFKKQLSSAYLDFLPFMPNLEKCMIRCRGERIIPRQLPAVECRYIHTLIIWDVLPPSPGQLLDGISLPALESLTVSTGYASLLSFIRRSPMPLQRLKIMSETLTDAEGLELLADLPSLRTFVTDSKNTLTHEFVHGLVSGTTLSPALETIVSEVPLPSDQRFRAAIEDLRVARPGLRITQRKVGLWEL